MDRYHIMMCIWGAATLAWAGHYWLDVVPESVAFTVLLLALSSESIAYWLGYPADGRSS